MVGHPQPCILFALEKKSISDCRAKIEGIRLTFFLRALSMLDKERVSLETLHCKENEIIFLSSLLASPSDLQPIKTSSRVLVKPTKLQDNQFE